MKGSVFQLVGILGLSLSAHDTYEKISHLVVGLFRVLQFCPTGKVTMQLVLGGINLYMRLSILPINYIDLYLSLFSCNLLV